MVYDLHHSDLQTTTKDTVSNALFHPERGGGAVYNITVYRDRQTGSDGGGGIGVPSNSSTN